MESKKKWTPPPALPCMGGSNYNRLVATSAGPCPMRLRDTHPCNLAIFNRQIPHYYIINTYICINYNQNKI